MFEYKYTITIMQQLIPESHYTKFSKYQLKIMSYKEPVSSQMNKKKKSDANTKITKLLEFSDKDFSKKSS